VVTDPHRVGHESEYHPGEVNLRRASIAIINKVDTATPAQVNALRANIQALNSAAVIIEARSPVSVDNPDLITGKTVLIVEDGPTLTHGGMKYGAATVAANKFGAGEILDPRPYAVGTIRKTLEQYPHIDSLLPAVGYSAQQVKDLEETINACRADIVISGTPIDLGRIVKINKPLVRVRYELEEIGTPSLEEVFNEYLKS
ncbi:MAG: GTPase, partial [SAR324 cluster bacterium]|nr:GTPase [SAR324 cluster bacterium]